MRWLVPSTTDTIVVALLVLLTFTSISTRLLGDAGIGWHIRTGQIILATHSIPHFDPFSSSMSGHPWFAWEWLYDVLVGWLDAIAGLNGVVFLTAVIISAVFAWTFRLLLLRGTNLAVAVILMLMAASAAMIHFQARPHVLSWLFALIWFWILESSGNQARQHKYRGSESPAYHEIPLWFLPPMMLVWVNLHGGFLTGFVLLAIYWLSAAWHCLATGQDRFADLLQRLRARRRVRILTLVGFLSALATLANPYGYKLHIHIYCYLSNRFLMNHIDEFQSPNFHYVAQKCFAVLLLLALLALAAKGRESTVSHRLLILFAVFSGLYASRNIPVSSLLLILVIGPWLSEAMQRFALSRETTQSASRGLPSANFLDRMQTIELGLRGHLWPIAAILLIGWIAIHNGKLGPMPLMHAHFDANRFPLAAASYLEKRDVQGPILAPDYWGGYLIYRLYPRAKVVVDDRHDFYGEQFLKSYLQMVHVEPGWQEFIQHNQPSCIIFPKDSALANILLETPIWRPAYSDNVAIVFLPSASSQK
jgi:hypothetical protein